MPHSFKKRFLIIYTLSTLLLVGVLLALFFFYAKNNLLENTQIRMQYTADAIAKSLLELNNASSLEPLKILEERFKNTPLCLIRRRQQSQVFQYRGVCGLF